MCLCFKTVTTMIRILSFNLDNYVGTLCKSFTVKVFYVFYQWMVYGKTGQNGQNVAIHVDMVVETDQDRVMVPSMVGLNVLEAMMI